MKKIVCLSFVFVCTILSLQAQTTPNFEYDVYGDGIKIEDIKDYSSHELGDLIARKLQAVENIYLLRYETKVGLNNSEIEVQKPDILQSVEKMDKYYKKAVKKQLLSKDEAVSRLSKYLDIAYFVFYEDSAAFERALNKAKKTEDIITIFEQVNLLNYNTKMEARN